MSSISKVYQCARINEQARHKLYYDKLLLNSYKIVCTNVGWFVDGCVFFSSFRSTIFFQFSFCFIFCCCCLVSFSSLLLAFLAQMCIKSNVQSSPQTSNYLAKSAKFIMQTKRNASKWVFIYRMSSTMDWPFFILSLSRARPFIYSTAFNKIENYCYTKQNKKQKPRLYLL